VIDDRADAKGNVVDAEPRMLAADAVEPCARFQRQCEIGERVKLRLQRRAARIQCE
jgi:hypothetical protein